MSIHDPQWGNSHRPESPPDQDQPADAPEVTGAAPAQAEDGIGNQTGNVNAGQPVVNDTTDTPPPAAAVPEPEPPTPPESPASPPPPKRSPNTPDGPPDLEELWAQWVYQYKCLIARLLRRPPPAPPGSHPPPATMPADGDAGQALSFKSWLIGVLLIGIAWLSSGFYLVEAQQVGVLSRLGRIIAVESAGWHWRLPYPIDSVRLINIERDRVLEIGMTPEKGRLAPGAMQSADGNLIDMAYAVTYQVVDPVAYLNRAENPADLLALLAETTLRGVVAEQNAAVFFDLSGKPEAAASAASAPVLKLARERLQVALDPLQTGIVVKAVDIRAVQLPAPVLQAVKDADRDEQTRTRSLRETQSSLTGRLIQARKLAAELQDDSAAYAYDLDRLAHSLAQVGGKAQTSAQAQTQFAQQVTALRQQYPLVFLNLDALRARVAGSNAEAATTDKNKASAGQATGAAPLNEWRDRERMDSRERVDRPGSL